MRRWRKIAKMQFFAPKKRKNQKLLQKCSNFWTFLLFQQFANKNPALSQEFHSFGQNSAKKDALLQESSAFGFGVSNEQGSRLNG
jgi:hypothetical protein